MNYNKIRDSKLQIGEDHIKKIEFPVFSDKLPENLKITTLNGLRIHHPQLRKFRIYSSNSAGKANFPKSGRNLAIYFLRGQEERVFKMLESRLSKNAEAWAHSHKKIKKALGLFI